ncbi:MAG TPA: hypothetical protein VFD36_12650 [Kofleriaceae bacterium]|nr:hypothetical protein [Kofleriaceae bacterium]
MMKRFVPSALALAGYILATLGISVAGGQADLGFVPDRMFFRYIAPSTGTVDLQMLPDNVNNPIVLPCDVEVFGGQADFEYGGTVPAVFPRTKATLFHGNSPIVSSGCRSNQVVQDVQFDMTAMADGAVQTDGYTVVSSTNQLCAWLFQPSDLPADTVVRVHLSVAGYEDSARTQLAADPKPANNQHDIFIRRSCTCQ